MQKLAAHSKKNSSLKQKKKEVVEEDNEEEEEDEEEGHEDEEGDEAEDEDEGEGEEEEEGLDEVTLDTIRNEVRHVLWFVFGPLNPLQLPQGSGRKYHQDGKADDDDSGKISVDINEDHDGRDGADDGLDYVDATDVAANSNTEVRKVKSGSIREGSKTSHSRDKSTGSQKTPSPVPSGSNTRKKLSSSTSQLSQPQAASASNQASTLQLPRSTQSSKATSQSRAGSLQPRSQQPNPPRSVEPSQLLLQPIPESSGDEDVNHLLDQTKVSTASR